VSAPTEDRVATGSDDARRRLRTLALPIISIAFAAAAASLVLRGATELGWLVSRLEVAAVVILVFGIGVRSERLAGFATAPALIGLVIGATGSAEIAWGRALIVGCLWYVATEAAVSSIEWSGGDVRVGASVLQRRLLDVATVVLLGASVGLLGVAVAGWAPDRTILARVVVLIAVLGALVAGVRHLASVEPGDSAPPG
jgi:hypothetical protein